MIRTNTGYSDIEPFDFYWKGRKELHPNKPYWHEPGIMDGGHMVVSYFKIIDSSNAILEVYNGHDSFGGEIRSNGIRIYVKKCEHYSIFWDDCCNPACDHPYEIISK